MRSTSSGTHPLVVLTAGRLVSSNALILTEVGKELEGIDNAQECVSGFHLGGGVGCSPSLDFPLSEVVYLTPRLQLFRPLGTTSQ